jgi:hypothetical protein
MKLPAFNRNKSLEQLEKNFRADGYFPTPLVEKVFKYRKIPVGDLSIEQLRLLIGQNDGLTYLIPLAIEKLKENIFAEGDLYEGDLFAAVLTSDASFWKQNPTLKQGVEELLSARQKEIEESLTGSKNRKLQRLIETFKSYG